MLILKSNNEAKLSVSELLNKIPNYNFTGKIAISWKIGKVRKLKSYNLISITNKTCSDCGNYVEVVLSKGSIARTYEYIHLGKSCIEYKDFLDDSVKYK